MQFELEDLVEQANEIQETLGRSYAVPDEIDEADLEAGASSFYHLRTAFSWFDNINFIIQNWTPWHLKKMKKEPPTSPTSTRRPTLSTNHPSSLENRRPLRRRR